MSKVYLDMTGRFDSAFGFGVSNLNGRVLKYNPYRFESFKGVDSEFEDVTLIYGDVTLNFAALPFIQQNKRAFNVPFSEPKNPEFGDIIAPPPLIAFTRSKKLITTDLNGEDVEVVERWNTDTYEIRMRGILVDMKEHGYPSNLVRQLHKLFEHNNTIEVSGTQFFEKDISYIYITSFEINGVPGFSDTVQYTITAKATSDINTDLLNS